MSRDTSRIVNEVRLRPPAPWSTLQPYEKDNFLRNRNIPKGQEEAAYAEYCEHRRKEIAELREKLREEENFRRKLNGQIPLNEYGELDTTSVDYIARKSMSHGSAIDDTRRDIPEERPVWAIPRPKEARHG